MATPSAPAHAPIEATPARLLAMLRENVGELVWISATKMTAAVGGYEKKKDGDTASISLSDWLEATHGLMMPEMTVRIYEMMIEMLSEMERQERDLPSASARNPADLLVTNGFVFDVSVKRVSADLQQLRVRRAVGETEEDVKEDARDPDYHSSAFRPEHVAACFLNPCMELERSMTLARARHEIVETALYLAGIGKRRVAPKQERAASPLRDVTNEFVDLVLEDQTPISEPAPVVLVESSSDDELLCVTEAYLLFLHDGIAGASKNTSK